MEAEIRSTLAEKARSSAAYRTAYGERGRSPLLHPGPAVPLPTLRCACASAALRCALWEQQHPTCSPAPPPPHPPSPGREPDASMQLRTFLSVLAPVAAREPSVFVEAVRATCSLSEAPSGMVAGRRAMIALRKKVRPARGRWAGAQWGLSTWRLPTMRRGAPGLRCC